jgi:hypothetical protein
MRRPLTYGLTAVFVTATFLAYTSAHSLIQEFSGSVTYVDLGVLFVLGLIAGFSLGLAYAWSKQA